MGMLSFKLIHQDHLAVDLERLVCLMHREIHALALITRAPDEPAAIAS